MKTLKTKSGIAFYINDEDYPRVAQFRWYADDRGYIKRNQYDPKTGVGHPVYLHRYITGEPKGVEVDHINGNRQDNQRHNLRLCSHAENARNKSLRRGRRLKGAYPIPASKRWTARIRVEGKLLHLGCFDSELHACIAYDQAALHYYGEFSRLNFPKDGGERTTHQP